MVDGGQTSGIEHYLHTGAELFDSDPKQALAAYYQAVSLDPSHMESWNQIGRLMFEMEQYAGAEQVFGRVAMLAREQGLEDWAEMAEQNVALTREIMADTQDGAVAEDRSVNAEVSATYDAQDTQESAPADAASAPQAAAQEQEVDKAEEIDFAPPPPTTNDALSEEAASIEAIDGIASVELPQVPENTSENAHEGSLQAALNAHAGIQAETQEGQAQSATPPASVNLEDQAKAAPLNGGIRIPDAAISSIMDGAPQGQAQPSMTETQAAPPQAALPQAVDENGIPAWPTAPGNAQPVAQQAAPIHQNPAAPQHPAPPAMPQGAGGQVPMHPTPGQGMPVMPVPPHADNTHRLPQPQMAQPQMTHPQMTQGMPPPASPPLAQSVVQDAEMEAPKSDKGKYALIGLGLVSVIGMGVGGAYYMNQTGSGNGPVPTIKSASTQPTNDAPPAPAMLGRDQAYRIGINYLVKKDYGKARDYLHRAHEKGHAEASYNLASLYAKGDGVEQNYKTSISYLEKASKQDYYPAMTNLGLLYAEGQGVEQDYLKARELWLKAAAGEHADAMHNLAVIYATGKGIDKDMEEAIKWYRKAANGGFVDSMANLGLIYANGDGVPRDFEKARRLWEKAAAKGHPVAVQNLEKLKQVMDKKPEG